MRVTVKLAHQIANGLQLVIGLIETGKPKEAKAAALALAKLVKAQTVVTIENCEECGKVRAILEPKREKT